MAQNSRLPATKQGSCAARHAVPSTKPKRTAARGSLETNGTQAAADSHRPPTGPRVRRRPAEPHGLDHPMFDAALASSESDVIAHGPPRAMEKSPPTRVVHRHTKRSRRKRLTLGQLGQHRHRTVRFAVARAKDDRHIAAVAKTSVGDFERHPVKKSGAPAQHRRHRAHRRLGLTRDLPIDPTPSRAKPPAFQPPAPRQRRRQWKI